MVEQHKAYSCEDEGNYLYIFKLIDKCVFSLLYLETPK